MQRSPRLDGMLGLACVAFWIGMPSPLVRAQAEPSGAGDRPTSSTPAESKGLPRITVTRLQVIKPAPGPQEGPAGFPRHQRFGFEGEAGEGTTLTLALEEPEQYLLGLEVADCKITRFRDDKGTDLGPGETEPAGAERPAPPQPGEEGPLSAKVDPGGHGATVTVHSPGFPAHGANRILLEAVLVLKYARGEKFVEQKGVDLKLDKITAGPVPLVIMSQGETAGMRRPKDTTEVTLFHPQPLRDAKKVTFIGPDGAEIPATCTGWGQSGSIHHTSYSLTRKLESCTIRLTVPEKVETVHMAVSINTGVGFPPFVSRRILAAPEPRPAATGAAPR